VKARIKTRAMSQWDVMRAFNLRLKRAFDERGMLFAGVMAAMAAAPAKAKPEAEDTTKDAAEEHPAAGEAPSVPAARPEGKTIVPPR
jgi:small conductance mechanosensitive channel